MLASKICPFLLVLFVLAANSNAAPQPAKYSMELRQGKFTLVNKNGQILPILKTKITAKN
jgi:hypothetical protein